jgi:hypothetical protein
MIFDDHEVADDWNIDRQWRDTVQGHPLGLRVLGNALAAYAVFQAWGNDPAQFQAGRPGRVLLDALPAWKGDERDATQAGALERIRRVLGLALQAADDRLVWHYGLDWPSHRVIVLDARTRRAYPEGRDPLAAPALLDDRAVDEQLVKPLQGPSKALNIVVAPAPIVGYPFVEQVAQLAYVRLAGGRRQARLGRDFEAWSFNPRCLEAVLRELAKAERVLILSGDVHYGFAATLDYWDERDKRRPAQTARLVQLTASGTKNETFLTRTLGGASFAQQRAGFDQWWRWHAALALTLLGAGLTVLPTDHSVLGWETRGPWLRWEGHPLTPRGDPPLEPVPSTTADAIAVPPDWRYRIRFQVDRRDDGERRPQGAPATPPIPQGVGPEQAYRLALVQRSRQRWSQMRRIVGRNNLGDVTFIWSDAERWVRQALWFTFDPNVLAQPGPYTVHDIRFAAPGPNDPKPDLDQG